MNEHRTFIFEYRLSARRILVTKETEVTVRGREGRFTFMYARTTEHGDEVTVYGGPMRKDSKSPKFITVKPEAINQIKKHKRRRSVTRKVK